MNHDVRYVPFSQRNGLAPIPPQLKLGEVSAELRRLIDYSIGKEIGREQRPGIDYCYFAETWLEVATDFHVRMLKQPATSFHNTSYVFRRDLEKLLASLPIERLFDMVEFFCRHPRCSLALKADLTAAFVDARAAYRIIDGQIIAIGNDDQAKAVEAALSDAESAGASGARQHLLAAGLALRDGAWADSVRESIHAVESMVRKIVPNEAKVGKALAAIEKRGHINGRLKAAFEQLYGYTNAEGGIRHAMLDDAAQVDEADALFMLGACAAFVSYLIARSATAAPPAR